MSETSKNKTSKDKESEHLIQLLALVKGLETLNNVVSELHSQMLKITKYLNENQQLQEDRYRGIQQRLAKLELQRNAESGSSNICKTGNEGKIKINNLGTDSTDSGSSDEEKAE